MNAAQSTLGYIGLGKMGLPMVRRLIEAGHFVHVYGRSQERLEPALRLGAVHCASPREVAQGADVVFTCLTDTAAVADVVLGRDGVADAPREGGLLVDMSTIDPYATRAMAEELRRRSGRRWVDAPISGGTIGAQAGTLAIMAGGEPADLDRLRPVLAHLGRNVTLMGPVGAGQTTKLINQVMVACGMVVMAEALGLAARSGIDAQAVPAALAGGRADSTMLQQLWPRMAQEDYSPAGTVESIAKDLEMLHAFGRATNNPMPVTALVTELYRWLLAQGHGEEDLTAAFRFYRPRDGQTAAPDAA